MKNDNNKLIIHIDDKNLTDEQAIESVLNVVKGGKISANNTAYCYVVAQGNGIRVISSKQPYGHKFHVGRWDK